MVDHILTELIIWLIIYKDNCVSTYYRFAWLGLQIYPNIYSNSFAHREGGSSLHSVLRAAYDIKMLLSCIFTQNKSKF